MYRVDWDLRKGLGGSRSRIHRPRGIDCGGVSIVRFIGSGRVWCSRGLERFRAVLLSGSVGPGPVYTGAAGSGLGVLGMRVSLLIVLE